MADRRYTVTIDTQAGLRAAEFLLELLEYSPPDFLSMSWYERVRPYAAGRVAMAYGYTLLAPYFELDESSPEAQKLFVQNGSRTNPRYSVGADPDVRRLSPIFEAVDAMSWRDKLPAHGHI